MTARGVWRGPALALMAFIAAAPLPAAGAEKPTILVAEFDYHDTSGEVVDQRAQHAARLAAFAAAVRRELDESGRYQVVGACPVAPCSAAEADPEALVGAARAAGARLVLYGGVHKASTLIQFLKAEMVDVESNQLVFQRRMSFRGDDDEAWARASRFLARDVVAAEITP